jgi:hypothetical protein
MVGVAMAGTPAPAMQLRRRVRVAVEKRARSLREPHRIVVRARIIKLACEGLPNAEIARQSRSS